MRLNVCDIVLIIKESIDSKRFGIKCCSSQVDKEIKLSYIYNYCERLSSTCVTKVPCDNDSSMSCDLVVSNLRLISTVEDVLTFGVDSTGGTDPLLATWVVDESKFTVVTQSSTQLVIRVIDPTMSYSDEDLSVTLLDSLGCRGSLSISFNFIGIPECFICLYPNNNVFNKCIYPNNDSNAEFLRN